MTKKAGPGSTSQRYKSANPDPHQNVMDPLRCLGLSLLKGGYTKLVPVFKLFSSSNYHKLVEVGSGSAIRIYGGFADDPDRKEIFLDPEYWYINNFFSEQAASNSTRWARNLIRGTIQKSCKKGKLTLDILFRRMPAQFDKNNYDRGQFTSNMDVSIAAFWTIYRTGKLPLMC